MREACIGRASIARAWCVRRVCCMYRVFTFVQSMREAGKIVDEKLTAADLIKRYDTTGMAGLERAEFMTMARDVLLNAGAH